MHCPQSVPVLLVLICSGACKRLACRRDASVNVGAVLMAWYSKTADTENTSLNETLMFMQFICHNTWTEVRRQVDLNIKSCPVTGTQTDTQTCVATIHFASSTTHAKCNKQ